MVDILYILQCAYYTDGVDRQFEVWKSRLWKSHTGRRLADYIPNDVTFEVINSTLQIGTSSDACFEPDLVYIENKIKEYSPKLIIPLGKVAESAIKDLDYEYFPAPHPAWRQLSVSHINEIKTKTKLILERSF